MSAKLSQPTPWKYVPWHVEEDSDAVRDAKNDLVCCVAGSDIARLIAAAPDLLAAAEAQKAADSEHANCKCWSEVGPCTKCGARFEEARELLYAAITRATTP